MSTHRRPNILFLMTDQMQGAVLEPGHPCRTPNFDRLISRGVRVTRACTPNAVCSPARASLMTGLLPHSHGVLEVTHCVDDDQCRLRADKPHWAQRLVEAGYRTGYFGKWHVERSHDLVRFGWQVAACERSAQLQQAMERFEREPSTTHVEQTVVTPGYRPAVFYRVTDLDPAHRPVGVVTTLAEQFLNEAIRGDEPWCCLVSCQEPHDPFICGKRAFDLYDPERLPLPASGHDPLSQRPNLYRKSQRTHAAFSDHDRKMAAACYFAMVTEIDEQYGRLLRLLENAGRLDDTIVVLTSDHGELLGAHGLYCKNISAFEEVYHIPMVLAGPGIAQGQTAPARVGLHDLAPTLCELTGVSWNDNGQSRTFAPLLREPARRAPDYRHGYAEYFGSRIRLQQRIVWDDPWKLVFNGFDFDELYNLDDDPHELRNRIDDPACADVAHRMFARMWSKVHATGDRALAEMHYQATRVAPLGPLTGRQTQDR